MKTRTKLFIAVLVLFAVALSNFGAYYYLFSSGVNISRKAVFWGGLAKSLDEFQNTMDRAEDRVFKFFISGDKTELDKASENISKIREELAGFGDRVNTSEALNPDAGLIKEITELNPKTEAVFKVLNESIRTLHRRYTGDNIAELKRYFADNLIESRLHEGEALLSALTAKVLQKAGEERTELGAILDKGLYLSVFLLLISISVLLGAFFILRMQIALGVERLVREIKGIESEGPGAVILAEKGDEFGEIAGAVNKLSRTLAETAISKAYLNDLLDSLGEGVVVTDEDGIIYSANLSFQKMISSGEEDLLGRPLWDLLGYSGAALRENFRSGAAFRLNELSLEQEGRDVKTYLSVHWEKLDSSNVYGKKVLYLFTFFDISARKALESQLFQSQKMEAIGVLAGGIAHDFNNLLGAMTGTTEVLKLRLKEDEQGYKKVQTLEKCIQRASGLTKQLLGFARKGKYELRSCRIDRIVDEAIKLIEKSFPKEITIQCHIPAGTWAVRGDVSQLVGVLLNLGLNAKDAISGEGVIRFLAVNEEIHADSPKLKEFGSLSPGKFVKVRVEDNGCGIPEENMEKIFDPFFTTKAAGKGTGLGLSMVFGIIKNHGGAVLVKSEVDAGTAFDIYLPADETVSVEKHYDFLDSSALKADDYTILSGKKLMLVDDEELVLDATSSFLEQYGIKVQTAQNGQEAVELYREDSGGFDAVIMDVRMPVKDGIEAFKEIRDLNPELPVVFFSGYADSEKILEARRFGGVSFIQKPYIPKEFLNTLLEIISSKAPQA